MDRLECQWCQAHNPAESITCQICGAPLDGRNRVSDSGWREAPRLRDMTEFRFANSTCQVEGELVPVAELTLGRGDAVYFEHHSMLWKDTQTSLTSVNAGGGIKRMLGGMPLMLTKASGVGRVAFARDHPGELVVLPLHPGMEIDAREHAFLVASHTVQYSFERIKGLANILHGGNGMYLDRFVTAGAPGLLILHGYGNVFERTLKAGETIVVEPGGFLYKDASVQMNARKLPIDRQRDPYIAEMVGPGRVGIQSMYVHHSTDDADTPGVGSLIGRVLG
jgi:uncharacterized protein (AIM24 family)